MNLDGEVFILHLISEGKILKSGPKGLNMLKLQGQVSLDLYFTFWLLGLSFASSLPFTL